MNLHSSRSYPSAPHIWRATLSLTACGIVCSFMLVIGLFSKMPQIAFHTSFILLTCLTSQILLWVFRKTRPLHLASWLYMANVWVALATVTLNHEFFVRNNLPFGAFLGVKMMAAIIALQTPMVRWVGGGCLFALAAVPFLQYFHWLPEIRQNFSSSEPWITLAIVTCASFIYFHRLNFFAVVEKKAKLEASATELRRFTHLLLGAQHLTNTPLQVIEGTTQLIRDQHPQTAPLVEKIEKAFVPIQNISQLMSFGNKHISWSEVHLPSSIDELEKEVRVLAKELAQNQTLFHLQPATEEEKSS